METTVMMTIAMTMTVMSDNDWEIDDDKGDNIGYDPDNDD